MKRALVAARLVAVLAACSSNKATSSTSASKATVQSATPETSSSTAPGDLNAKLLSVGDLPSGWSVNPSKSAGNPCLQTAVTGLPGYKTSVSVSFNGTGPDEGLTERALTVTDASSAMTAIPDAMAKCGQIHETVQGADVTATFSPMSFQPVGERSVAYKLSATITQGGTSQNAGGFLVFAQKDGIIIGLYYADDVPSLDAFMPLVTLAVDKA